MPIIRPKLEFFRFTLEQKDGTFKTFKDFAIEVLNIHPTSSDDKTMKTLLSHFVKSLGADIAKDDKLKKQIKLEKKSSNKYLTHRPKYKSEHQIISGVINGGSFGRDRILGDVEDNEEAVAITKNKSVLQYYYFLLYLPLDHNEGCFIIHSNGKEETITYMFKKFITNLFKHSKYLKPTVYPFCPESFQHQFKSCAVIDSIQFKQCNINSLHSSTGTSYDIGEYQISIEIKPVSSKVPIQKAGLVKKIFDHLNIPISKSKSKELKDFDQITIATKSTVDNSSKTFQWNTKDSSFIPTVYLEGRIDRFNDDGTPDFECLDKLSMNILQDEVLPEIRKDLYVSKAK